jgi:hypothetical protein
MQDPWFSSAIKNSGNSSGKIAGEIIAFLTALAVSK